MACSTGSRRSANDRLRPMFRRKHRVTRWNRTGPPGEVPERVWRSSGGRNERRFRSRFHRVRITLSGGLVLFRGKRLDVNATQNDTECVVSC